MKTIVSLIAIFGIAAAQAAPVLFKQTAPRPCAWKVEHRWTGDMEYRIVIQTTTGTSEYPGTLSGNYFQAGMGSCVGSNQGVMSIGVGKPGSGCKDHIMNCRAQYDWGYNSYDTAATGYVVVDHNLSRCPPTLLDGAAQAFGSIKWINACNSSGFEACSIGTKY